MDEITKKLDSFCGGTSSYAANVLGCVKSELGGYIFRTWAPGAKSVRVIGDFNSWRTTSYMGRKGDFFELYFQNAKEGDCYKFLIESKDGGLFERSDPFGISFDDIHRSSKIFSLDSFVWTDSHYKKIRNENSNGILNIYSEKICSRNLGNDDLPISFVRLAKDVVSFAKNVGYSHIELDSDNLLSLFSPPHGHGNPHTFMHIVNACHNADIGVILTVGKKIPLLYDSAIRNFDGKNCYDNVNGEIEISSPAVFSYVLSGLRFFIDKYHVDGFRFKGWENTENDRNQLKKLISEVKEFDRDCILISEGSTSPALTQIKDLTAKKAEFGLNVASIGNNLMEYLKDDDLCELRVFLGYQTAFASNKHIESEIKKLTNDKKEKRSVDLFEYIKRLNLVSKRHSALGFECEISSLISEEKLDVLQRVAKDDDVVIAILNTDVKPRDNIKIRYRKKCIFKPLVSSDEERYGGSEEKIASGLVTADLGKDEYEITFSVPAKSVSMFIPTYERTQGKSTKQTK